MVSLLKIFFEKVLLDKRVIILIIRLDIFALFLLHFQIYEDLLKIFYFF